MKRSLTCTLFGLALIATTSSIHSATASSAPAAASPEAAALTEQGKAQLYRGRISNHLESLGKLAAPHLRSIDDGMAGFVPAVEILGNQELLTNLHSVKRRFGSLATTILGMKAGFEEATSKARTMEEVSKAFKERFGIIPPTLKILMTECMGRLPYFEQAGFLTLGGVYGKLMTTMQQFGGLLTSVASDIVADKERITGTGTAPTASTSPAVVVAITGRSPTNFVGFLVPGASSTSEGAALSGPAPLPAVASGPATASPSSAAATSAPMLETKGEKTASPSLATGPTPASPSTHTALESTLDAQSKRHANILETLSTTLDLWNDSVSAIMGIEKVRTIGAMSALEARELQTEATLALQHDFTARLVSHHNLLLAHENILKLRNRVADLALFHAFHKEKTTLVHAELSTIVRMMKEASSTTLMERIGKLGQNPQSSIVNSARIAHTTVAKDGRDPSNAETLEARVKYAQEAATRFGLPQELASHGLIIFMAKQKPEVVEFLEFINKENVNLTTLSPLLTMDYASLLAAISFSAEFVNDATSMLTAITDAGAAMIGLGYNDTAEIALTKGALYQASLLNADLQAFSGVVRAQQTRLRARAQDAGMSILSASAAAAASTGSASALPASSPAASAAPASAAATQASPASADSAPGAAIATLTTAGTSTEAGTNVSVAAGGAATK